MLTRKYLKTIIVNLSVNYYQFKESVLFGLEECAMAHWQSQTKEDVNKYINPYYILKVYLSIGTLENCSHSYYTRKSKNVKPYTIIIPKKVNFGIVCERLSKDNLRIDID